MFYQYSPHSPAPGLKHWGHAASDDLVHWRHLPIALYPTPDTADEDGCWSGCSVVKDGKPILIYTGVRAGIQLPCMAVSADDHLIRWEKHPSNPIISATPEDYDLTGFRDHSIWREDEEWAMVIGSGIKGVGGAVFRYRSANLLDWRYDGPLLIGDLSREDGLYAGTEWECPDFISMEGRHFLILSTMEMIGRKWSPLYTLYFSGQYQQGHFITGHKDKVDHGDAAFYAPQSMVDEQGRRLMWGWVMEERCQEDSNEAGWAGVMSLPRRLDLDEQGDLISYPIPELKTLRKKVVNIQPQHLLPEDANPLEGLQGRALEISARFEMEGETVFDLDFCCSVDGREFTRLRYDGIGQVIILDRSHSSLSDSVAKVERRMPFVGQQKTLTLRIFLDHSVVEINVNGRDYITSRIYPQLEDSAGLRLSVRQGAIFVKGLDLWEMASMWEV